MFLLMLRIYKNIKLVEIQKKYSQPFQKIELIIIFLEQIEMWSFQHFYTCFFLYPECNHLLINFLIFIYLKFF